MILYRADTFAVSVEAFECEIATDDFVVVKGACYHRQGNHFKTEVEAWRYLIAVNTAIHSRHVREAERCHDDIEKCKAAIEKCKAAAEKAGE